MYVNGRRGVGALLPGLSTVAGSSGHGTCSAAYWNLNPLALFDNACKYAAPPAPGAPTTTLVPNGGVDVAGNPTYDVVTQSPQDNQAAYVGSVQSFIDNLDTTVNPPANGPTGANWLLLGAVSVGLVVFASFFGGHR